MPKLFAPKPNYPLRGQKYFSIEGINFLATLLALVKVVCPVNAEKAKVNICNKLFIPLEYVKEGKITHITHILHIKDSKSLQPLQCIEYTHIHLGLSYLLHFLSMGQLKSSKIECRRLEIRPVVASILPFCLFFALLPFCATGCCNSNSNCKLQASVASLRRLHSA